MKKIISLYNVASEILDAGGQGYNPSFAPNYSYDNYKQDNRTYGINITGRERGASA